MKQTEVIGIQGMTCHSCVNAVTSSLTEIDGLFDLFYHI